MWSNCTINITGCDNGTKNGTDGKIYNMLASIPIFMTVYLLILSFALLGNGLVCYIVKATPAMHNVTNYLLVNLAISDLLAALSTVFQFTDFVVKDLNLGDVGCKFQINLLNIPYGSSCVTLTFIAVERYFAVCQPLRFQSFKKRMKYIIPLTWLISLLVYLPTLLYCGARHDKESNQLSCDCSFLWPDQRAKDIHGVFIVFVCYFIPLFAVIIFYSKVIRRLRVTPNTAESSNIRPTDSEAQKSKKRVVKMLLVTIAIFFLLWTPYNILYLLKRFHVDYRGIYSYVWYPSLLLGFLSTAYNPIVYCLMGKQFKEGFKSILCCCCLRGCCRWPSISLSSIWSSKTTDAYSLENIESSKSNDTS